MRLWKVPQGGQGYYLDVAEGTGSGIEPAGGWLGRGAEVFGLRGRVDERAIGAVLEGRDPQTSELLSPNHARVVVRAYDLTYCAPKSVSLLHALGAREVADEVYRGHERAVEESLGYLELHGAAVRRKIEGHRIPTTVEGLSAAAFVHSTSRALDPHLHTHVVVANLGRDLRGTWSALDGRGIYAHRAAADALYHAHLRHELSRRLGVEWEAPRYGRADLKGIGKEVRSAFSTRSAQIASRLESSGRQGRRASELASLSTRDPKRPDVGPKQLLPMWQEKATSVGLGPRRLEAVVGSAALTRDAGDPLSAISAMPPTEQLLSGLSEIGPTTTRRQVVRALCGSLRAGAPARAVDAEVDIVCSSLQPARDSVGRAERPGVAERKLQLEHELGPTRDPDLSGQRRREREELRRLLAGRGMELTVGREPGRSRDEGLGLGL